MIANPATRQAAWTAARNAIVDSGLHESAGKRTPLGYAGDLASTVVEALDDASLLAKGITGPCPGSGEPPATVINTYDDGSPFRGLCRECSGAYRVNSDGGLYRHRRSTS